MDYPQHQSMDTSALHSLTSEMHTADLTALAWVLPETQNALAATFSAFQQFTQDAQHQAKQPEHLDFSALHQARQHYHQAIGALQIVDLQGIQTYGHALETLWDALESGRISLTQAMTRQVEHALQSLSEYLEDLALGAPESPLKLFLPYQEVLTAARAERVHPADLWTPQTQNLNLPSLAKSEADALNTAQPISTLVDDIRHRYEAAMLNWLRTENTPVPNDEIQTAMQVLADCMVAVANVGHDSNPTKLNYWALIEQVFHAIRCGGIASNVQSKKLAARVNTLLKQYARYEYNVPERLFIDTLFELAFIDDNLIHDEEVLAKLRVTRRAMALPSDGLLSESNYTQPHYALVSKQALIQSRQQVQQVREDWESFAAGDAASAAPLAKHLEALQHDAQAFAQPALPDLIHVLREQVTHLQSQPQVLSTELGIEFAATILFLQQSFQQPWKCAGTSSQAKLFGQRCKELAVYIQQLAAGKTVPTLSWLDDISRTTESHSAHDKVLVELRTNLQVIVSHIDAFDRDPNQTQGLHAAEQLLDQSAAILNTLNASQASEVVQNAQLDLQALLTANPSERTHLVTRLADDLGSLHFYFDTLQYGSMTLGMDVIPPLIAETSSDLTRTKATPENHHHLLNQVRAQLTQLHNQHATDSVTDPLETDALQFSLEALQHSAMLNDDLPLRNQANQALSLLPQVQSGSADAIDFMSALFETTHKTEQAQTQTVMPHSDVEMDAELLEIFLSEAQEVLGNVETNLPLLATKSADLDVMTQVRRAFHTLKGSGRMVGLKAFGEAAWSIEQVLNVWLAESRPATEPLLALLNYAKNTLQIWVREIESSHVDNHQYESLATAAEQVKQGGDFTLSPVASDAATTEAELTKEAKVDEPEVALPISTVVSESTQAPIESFLSSQIKDVEALPKLEALSTTEHELSLTQTLQKEQQVIAANETNVIEFPFATALAKDEDHYKNIGPLRISLPLYNVYLQEADMLVTRLTTDFSEWKHEARTKPTELALRSAHSLQGSSATVGLEPVRKIAAQLESTLEQLQQRPMVLGNADLDTLAQCVEMCRSMLHQFAAGIWPKDEPSLDSLLQACQLLGQTKASLTNAASQNVQDAAPVLATGVNQHIESNGVTDKALDHTLQEELGYDAVLLPIFIEEAQESIPQLGASLRQLAQSPNHASTTQQLLRQLHTLKGSARMAGVMPLGQAAHEMESTLEVGLRQQKVDAAMIDRLYQHYDKMMHQLEQLQRGEVLAVLDVEEVAPVDSSPDIAVPASVPQNANDVTKVLTPTPLTTSVEKVEAAAETSLAVERNRAVVRVQAQTLDLLINDASEVGISRARLENEIGSLKTYLFELNDNVGRLRGQLRELEIQAESQMQSRLANANEKHEQFDPLEFDRFTRFQEVTRMMAESVNDVATVQTNLLRGFENTESDLSSQNRLTRNLQQNLMHARMVQFDTISERLYRVARQAADETGKQVRLVIKGASVELDRSVLDRMAGPLEHLLRNAVVHGVETQAERLAKGKPPVGELVLEVQQEGNEVVLHFFDDGAGLDFARIRTRAIENKLLDVSEEANENRLSELIFAPGFSTTDKVTALAGRGVGMDVVRTETAALGGRIGLQSVPQQGTRFTIHLPLTTAITQVLLVKAGGRVYALPSGMIDQVTQLKSTELAQAYNNAAIDFAGQQVPLYYFGLLLEVTSGVPAGQKYAPIVVVRSGNERVAVHVDEVVGNREVVVKNIGNQLARLEGIAGATVLGNGEIVLIYNPIMLGARYQRVVKLAQKIPQEIVGAVAEMHVQDIELNDENVTSDATSQTTITKQGPVAGLATQPTVMVVDDSLTVRKISQRLLTRAGYQVVLAKDGVDALKQLQSITPNIMLVDIEMPHMDGFDLTRNIRADDRIKNMPIIMITSRTADKHRQYAQEIGVNAYLGKPFNDQELLAQISQFLSQEAGRDLGTQA